MSERWKRRASKMPKHNKYLMFLGCAIPYRVSAYEISARKVLKRLGIEVEEMPEFNCCGLPLDPVSHEMMLILAARNLALAEREGLDIITLCPGCAGTLKKGWQDVERRQGSSRRGKQPLERGWIRVQGNGHSEAHSASAYGRRWSRQSQGYGS